MDESDSNTQDVETYRIGGGTYYVGDARDLPELLPDGKLAAAAVVDLPWARPQRNGVGICYPTYDAEEADDELWEFVDAVYESLAPGGWAFFDCDGWFLPRLITYLQESWGDVNATYRGGGYRKPGWVRDTGGRGHYFTNSGYPVVFAHKGETEQVHGVGRVQDANGPPREVSRAVDWESLKPIHPYRVWLGAVVSEGDLVAIPCAGTSPAAIASESLGVEWVAVDSERGAVDAYRQRRELQLDGV